MGLLIGSIILTIVLAVAGVAGATRYNRVNRERNGWLMVSIALVGPAILLLGAFTRVDANEVGIIYDDRYGVMEEVKLEGFQAKSIFEHITPISTAVKTVTLGATKDEVLGGQTRDSVYATFVITTTYHIRAADAGLFFKKTGSTDITSAQLNAAAKQALQAVTINYDIYGLLSTDLEAAREEFQTQLTTLLYAQYYITLDSASFDDIDAGDLVEQTIQAKAQAQQQIEIAQANQDRAEIENATALMNAQALADAAVIAAQGAADAVQIAADAEAYKVMTEKTAVADLFDYYRTELPGLTDAEIADVVMSVIYYATWNGELPMVVGDASVFIPLP
ncbi:MAG: SPFH domain-containing protein [Candidatus Izemoplasmatales bacterium]